MKVFNEIRDYRHDWKMITFIDAFPRGGKQRKKDRGRSFSRARAHARVHAARESGKMPP